MSRLSWDMIIFHEYQTECKAWFVLEDNREM